MSNEIYENLTNGQKRALRFLHVNAQCGSYQLSGDKCAPLILSAKELVRKGLCGHIGASRYYLTHGIGEEIALRSRNEWRVAHGKEPIEIPAPPQSLPNPRSSPAACVQVDGDC